MRLVLVVGALLAGVAAQQVYLPPNVDSTGSGGGVQCAPVRTITQYSTGYVTDTRFRQVTRQVPQFVTETLTRTAEQVVVSTRIQQQVRTVETTLVQPTTLLRTAFRTSVQVASVNVPQVQVVSRVQTVPGPVVIPVQSVVQVPRVQTVQATATRQFERTLFRTFTQQQVVPRDVVSTRVVNSQVVRTQTVQATRRQVEYNTRLVTVQQPAQPVYSTVFRTDVRVVTVPGRAVPVVRTQVVDQVVSREVVQTRVVPQVVRRTVRVTQTMRAIALLPCLLAAVRPWPQDYPSYNTQSAANAGGLSLFSRANSGASNTQGFGSVFSTGQSGASYAGGSGATGSGALSGTALSSSGLSGGSYSDQVVTLPRLQTQVQEVVSTVDVPVRQTQFVTRTTVVPDFVTRTVVQTNVVTQTVFNTRTQTQFSTQEVVSTVRLPDVVNTVTQTRFRTQVQTQFRTQTVLVTRRRLRTDFRTVTSTQVVQSTVRVPQLVLSTSVVQVPGPAQTRVRTAFNNREVTSFVVQQPRTIVQTQTNVQTQVVTQQVRQPDQFVTITSVQVVPVTSLVVRTQLVPQLVTVTRTVANTVTRTEVTTRVVRVPSVRVRTVLRTNFNTQVVTRTQQVVQTDYQERVQTVRVPSQPQTLVRTQAVVVTSTQRLPDTYTTRVVTVNNPRQVLNTRFVQRVQTQQVVVTQTVSEAMK
ncbi:uncharacterized protein LOC119094569 [Pollicipes pollicipes]|uniref:uncharacterized protein LOC119094569 n=1 Tax=Pollicipes pollicipes TaxID=41117 RepID=UPI001884BD14|nr:uncharacterized protein LOC119094569 [Pollicipes pollicipes]